MTAAPTGHPPFAERPGAVTLPRLVVTVALALSAMNGLWWLLAALSGQWITDARGIAIETDFTNVYAAGRMALEGHAAQAYDWEIHKRAQEAVLGHGFDGYFGWHYPPPYLFVAAALARLPYGVAFVTWVIASAVPYALTVRRLVGHPAGWLIAAGCPLALHNVLIGQNGFLTATLIGAAMLSMPKRPWLAGVCVGLLIYKPQYGLMFPVALLAGRQWRVIAGAALTAAVLVIASWTAFGTQTWTAFFDWLPRASQAFLVEGEAVFGKLQSVLALVRYLGGGDAPARTLQAVASLGAAAGLAAIWWSRAAHDIKAAALATTALIATPYLYPYDMVVLVLPVALILRHGARTGFLPHELPALAIAVILLVVFPFVVAPVGLGATLLVAAVVARRALGDPRGAEPACSMGVAA
ncbi:MAG: glycosyltransferase family 87 protein [Xanthobacteraceae bacterium]|nr:glycosyltransferase family 87 protein [Xanthobacteraceae bacterium]